MEPRSKSFFSPKNSSLKIWWWYLVSKMISFQIIAFSLYIVKREFSGNDLWQILNQNQHFTLNHPWKFQEDISKLNWGGLQLKVLDQAQLNFSTTRANGIFWMVTPYETQVKIMILTQKIFPENLVMISCL